MPNQRNPASRKRAILAKSAKILTAVWVIALAFEVAIASLDPNEILGWGERPALRPDPELGWRLVESQTTRLRWESLDYVVTSNSLGFPGPEYPRRRNSTVFRILVAGSGFTSAEGVDTDHAWPRVLESIGGKRCARDRVEVLNFAITGYGPRQYAAVVEEYAPIYEPDAIVVTSIPNDLKKVLRPISTRVRGIGFDRPHPNGLYAVFTFRHLDRFLRDAARELVLPLIYGGPDPRAYSFGQLWAFEKGRNGLLEDSQLVFENQLSAMKSVSDELGSQLVLLLAPSPLQVCSPEQLPYYPDSSWLMDSTRINLDQPQQVMQASAEKLGIEYHDLREVFDLSPGDCFYTPRNMFLTEQGHRAVAEFLAGEFW